MSVICRTDLPPNQAREYLVNITAEDVCGSDVADTGFIYANLEADNYDIDLGGTIGATFGSITVGNTMDVDPGRHQL
eukprot:CAMPEP_0114335482 /NCGR_PEP_ID=MMETSP0101-20121206/5089_1 /TAXON_ID=38822 ORGANISM="Pteridomonas danica, Strain PT" /NCGR_SAMPLE_ID=MMETSP0101 /ASSEMBLY_ACC=CAM_ASM_000211 /LENGTH=76 /DNA_ID=CAMNT_0001467125 /DNA_START=292 /DNA_END=522 /DNA_ORIENTATION=-